MNKIQDLNYIASNTCTEIFFPYNLKAVDLISKNQIVLIRKPESAKIRWQEVFQMHFSNVSDSGVRFLIEIEGIMHDIRLIPHAQWHYAKTYYQIRPLSTMMNACFSRLNMIYNGQGLYYIGAKTPILVSTNIEDIFKFAEIDKNAINKFTDSTVLFNMIKQSKFFDARPFKTSTGWAQLPQEIQDHLIAFQKHLGVNCTLLNTITEDSVIEMIDNAFPMCAIRMKIESVKSYAVKTKESIGKFDLARCKRALIQCDERSVAQTYRHYIKSFDSIESFNAHVSEKSSQDLIAEFVSYYNDKHAIKNSKKDKQSYKSIEFETKLESSSESKYEHFAIHDPLTSKSITESGQKHLSDINERTKTLTIKNNSIDASIDTLVDTFVKELTDLNQKFGTFHDINTICDFVHQRDTLIASHKSQINSLCKNK